MKIRQVYTSTKGDLICIQYIWGEHGTVAKYKEISPDLDMELGEYSLPTVEVTDTNFIRIINNHKLS